MKQQALIQKQLCSNIGASEILKHVCFLLGIIPALGANGKSLLVFLSLGTQKFHSTMIHWIVFFSPQENFVQ